MSKELTEVSDQIDELFDRDKNEPVRFWQYLVQLLKLKLTPVKQAIS